MIRAIIFIFFALHILPVAWLGGKVNARQRGQDGEGWRLKVDGTLYMLHDFYSNVLLFIKKISSSHNYHNTYMYIENELLYSQLLTINIYSLQKTIIKGRTSVSTFSWIQSSATPIQRDTGVLGVFVSEPEIVGRVKRFRTSVNILR